MNSKVPDVNLRYDKRIKGKSYYFDYFLNGERVRERIGVMSQNQAKHLLGKKINELHNLQGLVTKRSKISLSQAVDIHMLSKEKTVRDSTMKKYRSNKYHINEAIKTVGEKYFKDFATVTEAQFQLLADTLKGRSTSDHRKNNLLVFLKAVENTAIKRGYIAKKISYDIKTCKPDPQLKVQYFKLDELQKIWPLINDFYLDYFKFLVHTGLRVGELVNLRWENVDLDNKKMTVENHVVSGVKLWKPKTKTSIRHVPLGKEAREIIKKHFGKNEIYVFTSVKGRQLHVNTLYTNFKNALKKVEGSEHKSTHTLRHTFASLNIQEGLDLYRLATYMGHSSTETTRLYAHLCPTNDAELMDRIKV